MSTTLHLTAEEIEHWNKRIYWYRKQNKENALLGADGIRFSRACSGCDEEVVETGHRYFSSTCGHTFCEDCALLLEKCPQYECEDVEEETVFARLIEDKYNHRECGVCLYKNTLNRHIFIECGHSVCEPCIIEKRLDGIEKQVGSLTCPFCQVESATVNLNEEELEREYWSSESEY